MPWFRVDDGFYDHPKVRRAGNAAIGLWLRCATYSARHLTDGRIPAEVVRELGRPREAAALVTAGLWQRGSDEYVIPDYLDYNYSAEQVKQRRKNDAERKRKPSKSGTRNRPTREPDLDPFDE
jgi:hypothetical protein